MSNRYIIFKASVLLKIPKCLQLWNSSTQRICRVLLFMKGYLLTLTLESKKIHQNKFFKCTESIKTNLNRLTSIKRPFNELLVWGPNQFSALFAFPNFRPTLSVLGCTRWQTTGWCDGSTHSFSTLAYEVSNSPSRTVETKKIPRFVLNKYICSIFGKKGLV